MAAGARTSLPNGHRPWKGFRGLGSVGNVISARRCLHFQKTRSSHRGGPFDLAGWAGKAPASASIGTIVSMVGLRRIRRSRAIPLALAVTWLPYISTRCVVDPGTHAGCGVLPTAAHAHPEDHHAHAHSHDGSTPAHSDHGHRRSPARTCCEVTGKCNIKVTSPAPSADPPAVTVTASAVEWSTVPSAENVQHWPAHDLAHGPPTYLRNATLRI